MLCTAWRRRQLVGRMRLSGRRWSGRWAGCGAVAVGCARVFFFMNQRGPRKRRDGVAGPNDAVLALQRADGTLDARLDALLDSLLGSRAATPLGGYRERMHALLQQHRDRTRPT